MSGKKFSCFRFDDGRTTNKAYLDGYSIGDRLLEGVPIEVEINADGSLRVEFYIADDAARNYIAKLNREHWVTVAKEFAEEYDIFSSTPDLCGEDVALEEAS